MTLYSANKTYEQFLENNWIDEFENFEQFTVPFEVNSKDFTKHGCDNESLAGNGVKLVNFSATPPDVGKNITDNVPFIIPDVCK